MFVIKMSNKSIFKALSSQTRVTIIKFLLEEELHVSGLAKKLEISVPVTSRHVKILEDVGLINKKVFGNVHILSANIDGFKRLFDPFIEEEVVTISKDESLFDVLKQMPSIRIKKIGKNNFITEVDHEQGHYLYGIDGERPNVPIDEFKPHKEVLLELDKIIPIRRRKIRVKIKKESNID